ncbi:LAQU0S27e00606g1_1 [Lachancea quebecensis]|uniref:Protein SOP4 n=1 Tax=Lachancea quebecensis TaxID=1654605 RepID=A0A0P1L580_9SACH|nr:LAQU0S27e00606g1_1 [Lachancea quebecensis]
MSFYELLLVGRTLIVQAGTRRLFWTGRFDMVLVLFYLICGLCSSTLAATVSGRLDLGPLNITRKEVVHSSFKLLQVGNFTGPAYSSRTTVRDVKGNFRFEGVPEPKDANSSTYFVLQPSSLDYNLKPGRILVQLVRDSEDAQRVATKAFKNKFGRENFASPEILYPEKLEEVEADPHITFSLVNAAPFREYITERNVGILKSGPVASILNSKFKMAAVITAVLMLLFPYLLEKFDSETALAIKEDRLEKQKQKYAEQKQVSKQAQRLEKT